MRRTLILAYGLAFLLGACVAEAPGGATNPVEPQPYVVPPPRPAPIPPPRPPTPPTPVPVPVDPLAAFKAVKVGDPESALSGLPTPSDTATVGDITLRSWTTTVPRPTGGFVQWEIAVRNGVVTASHPW